MGKSVEVVVRCFCDFWTTTFKPKRSSLIRMAPKVLSRLTNKINRSKGAIREKLKRVDLRVVVR